MYDDPLWRSIIYHKQWSQQQTIIAKLYLWLKQYTWIQHINAYKLFISLLYSYKKIINQTADCKSLRSRASINLSSVRNVRHHNAKTAQLSCHLRTYSNPNFQTKRNWFINEINCLHWWRILYKYII